MIITCDNCNTSFELEDALVKEDGSKVKCTNCGHVFVAHSDAQIEEFALDLSDTDIKLEMEDIEPAESNPSEDEEEEFELEMDSEDESDMLDLSDLEKMLEMESVEEYDADIERDETELELELDFESEPEEDDLSLAEESKDVDLADLEEMLELDETDIRDGDSDEGDIELELDLEMDADDGVPSAEKIPTAEDELDLSDIEKLLEMDDEQSQSSDEDEEEIELELDLGIEDEAGDEKLALEMDDHTEDHGFDLEDNEEMKSADVDLDAFALELEEDEADIEEADDTLSDQDDIDIDFDIEPEEAVEEADISLSEIDEEKEETVSEGFGMGVAERETAQPTKPAEPAFTTKLPVPKKKSKLPVILVILLLVIGGIGGGYYYLDQQGMLPFGKKSGSIQPLDHTFKHYFVENQNAGSLFVITGYVENEFNNARSNIRVNGELVTDNAKVAQTQIVHCGNVLSEMELSTLDMKKIKQKLMNASGEKQSNINIKPGAKIPFMIVFDNYPANLAEYRIQIAGSLPAGK